LPRTAVCDAEDEMSSSFIGEGAQILESLIEAKGLLGFLELEVRGLFGSRHPGFELL
jgi:hypothetical protein